MTISQDAGTDASAAPAQPAGRFSASRIRIRVGFLVVPALLFLTVFYLYPLFRLISQSVEGTNLSLEHYITFFTDSLYLSVLMRTMIMSASTTLICLLLGYPVAYFLTKVKGSARNLIFLLIIVPYLTSFLVRTYAWLIILNNRGIANGILTGTGIVDEPVQLLYNKIGVYIGMVHIMLPFMILPLYAVMQGIDRRLVRAAHSLGSSPVGAFFKVFLPLSLPGVQSGCLLVFLITLGFYITPALLGGLGDMMLVNMIDIQVERLGNWGFASAASVIPSRPFGVFFLIGGAGPARFPAGASGPAGARCAEFPRRFACRKAPSATAVAYDHRHPRAQKNNARPHAAPARRVKKETGASALTQFSSRPGAYRAFFSVSPTLGSSDAFNSAQLPHLPRPQVSRLRWYSEGSARRMKVCRSASSRAADKALSHRPVPCSHFLSFAGSAYRCGRRMATRGPSRSRAAGVLERNLSLRLPPDAWAPLGSASQHSKGPWSWVGRLEPVRAFRSQLRARRRARGEPLRTFFFVTPVIRPASCRRGRVPCHLLS